MSTPATRVARGRRIAERPPTRWQRRWSRLRVIGTASWWLLVLLAGVAALVLATVGLGPLWLDDAGAVAVVTAASWALAARTGGRRLVSAALALGLGLAAALVGGEVLRTGAAVLTCVVVGVLGVMATVPANGYLAAVREVGLAMAAGVVGAFAAIGFEPTLVVSRFEYATLVLGLLLGFVLVHRLGAGLHGIGRRGLLLALVGAVLVLATMVYAELLRTYGVQGVVEPVLRLAEWSRTTIGAFPRPLVVLLGVPALAWGCHMRARRRQGWWVCAFGVAATVSVGHSLVDTDGSLATAGLQVLYSVLLGLVVGFLLVRADLRLTGSRGRRGRRAERAAAHRPEPSRFRAL